MPTTDDVAHLLRRAGFGGTLDEITTLAAQPLATTVDQLLDFSAAPADTPPSYLTDDGLGDWEKEFRLQAWWLDRMATTTTPLQEKLTLFWHGHFATANGKVGNTLLMYRQNALFRQMAAGNFRDLVQQMALQPAMLNWLDNNVNVVGRPNENFARELMELFTLGVNHYTQSDVTAAARAWTGYNTLDSDNTQYNFYPSRHDNGMKTFMGQSRAWTGPDIIDYILDENDQKKMVAARFIAGKMWSFFAYPNPEPAVLDAIAQPFHDADLDISALVRAIFLHPQFMSAEARVGLVRSPAEWIAACLRCTGLTAANTNPQWWMEAMGQELFEPPNVAGWDENAYWLGTANVWARANWSRYVTWQINESGALDTALGTTPTMTVGDAVQAAFTYFQLPSPSAQTRSRLETWLTRQRRDSHAWTNYGFINLFTLMMLSPDMAVA